MTADRDEVKGLREFIEALREGKRLIAVTTLLCTVVAVANALLATKIYRSEALVEPRQYTGNGDIGGAGAQFSGFGALAGVSIGGVSDRAIAIATLKSRTVVETFIAEKHLLPRLYESAWDSKTNNWQNPAASPTTWDAYNYFTDSVLKVSEDIKTGLVKISVEWKDPVEAQQWVTELIERTNACLKDREVRDGQRNLAYLEEQSHKIGQVEVQHALYGLVESEMKKLMVAEGAGEYAFKVIDPAVVPKRKVRPRRALILLIGTCGGFGLGALLAVMRRKLRGL